MKMFFIPENWDQELMAEVWEKFFQIPRLGYRKKCSTIGFYLFGGQ